MNIAQTLLPVKQAVNSGVSDKSADSSLRSGSRKSFNETFNRAVSRSDKPAASEQGQITGQVATMPDSDVAKPALNTIVAGQGKEVSTSGQQAATDSGTNPPTETKETVGTEAKESGQHVLVDSNTAALAAMMAGVPVNTEPATNLDKTVATTVPAVSESQLLPGAAQQGQTPAATVPPVALPDVTVQTAHLTQQAASASQQANPVPQAETAPQAAAPEMAQALASRQGYSIQGQGVAPVQDQNAAAESAEQQVVPVSLTAEARTQQHNSNSQNKQDSGTGLESQAQALAEPDGSAPDGAANSRLFMEGLEAAFNIKGSSVSTATAEVRPANLPPDVHQVVEQIVEQTRMVAKLQNTEMIIKLKPEHLGELTLKIAIDKGAVNASFHSNNPEVRGLIEASLAQLKQELTNNGLKVENVSVYAGLSQFLPNHEHERNFRQQVIKFTNKKNADETVEAIENQVVNRAVAQAGGLTGVDYRI